MGKRRNPHAKVTAAGRSAVQPHVRLDHGLLMSPAYRSLSATARALLVDMTMMEKGRHNGDLFLSVRDAADLIGLSDLKAARSALDELQDRGFVEMAADAHFAVKASEGSRARSWRLTWLAVQGRKGPSNEYRDAERAPGPKTPAHRRMERGLKFLKRWRQTEQKKSAVEESITHPPERVEESTTTTRPEWLKRGKSVEESTTRFSRNGGKPTIAVVEESTTHNSYHATAAPTEPSNSPKPQSSTPLLRAAPDAPNRILATIQERWPRLAREDREAVARQHGVSPREIDQACDGTGGLLFPKLVAIRATLNTWRAAA